MEAAEATLTGFFSSAFLPWTFRLLEEEDVDEGRLLRLSIAAMAACSSDTRFLASSFAEKEESVLAESASSAEETLIILEVSVRARGI